MKKTSKRTGGSRKRSGGRRPNPVAEVLGDFKAVADRTGLRWYVFGAQAAILYGVPRATADIDVTADVTVENLPAFVKAMKTRGFEAREPDLADFVRTTSVAPFEHRRSGWPLDVVLAGTSLEERFFTAVHRVDVQGLIVPVIAPEDLVVAKVLAGRSKDLDDVRGILRARTLDHERIEGLLAELEQGLGQSDLVPRWKALVREARR